MKKNIAQILEEIPEDWQIWLHPPLHPVDGFPSDPPPIPETPDLSPSRPGLLYCWEVTHPFQH